MRKLELGICMAGILTPVAQALVALYLTRLADSLFGLLDNFLHIPHSLSLPVTLMQAVT